MTRIEAVRFAIELMEKERRIFSENCMGLKAAKGAEAEFGKLDDAIQEMKKICQVLQVESVKRSIAAWQHDLMEEPEQLRMPIRRSVAEWQAELMNEPNTVKTAMKELEPGA